MARREAGPYSINEPKLVLLLVTAAMVDVPVLVMLQLARGLVAAGRTRTFCQVSEQATLPPLTSVTVKEICVVVRDVIATELPLATPLIFLLSAPVPVTRPSLP